MSNNILSGQTLVAGEGQGQLSQYYGLADAAQTTVTQAALTTLSTAYTVPAGEAAYPGAAYELCCAGNGVWGATQQVLTFSMFAGAAFGLTPAIGAVALNASQAFSYSIMMKLTCSDGVNTWWADLIGTLTTSGVNLIPGTAGAQSIPFTAVNTGARTFAVSGAMSVAVQAKWASTTGAPTITNTKTTFRKIA